MPEEHEKDERRKTLKGRVAVDGLLRCLSEDREVAQSASGTSDESKKSGD